MHENWQTANNPNWQKRRNITFLWKYYIVISDTMVGSFLDIFFLLLPVILSEFYVKPNRKIELQKKYKAEFVWGSSLFWLHALLSMSFFVAFFIYSFPFPKWRNCTMAHMVGILCDNIMSDSRKYESLLQFTTRWLASPRTWYYFRVCFSFSFSSCFLFWTSY